MRTVAKGGMVLEVDRCDPKLQIRAVKQHTSVTAG